MTGTRVPLKIMTGEGVSAREATETEVPGLAVHLRALSQLAETRLIAGPRDEDIEALREVGYRPEVAEASTQSRLAFEQLLTEYLADPANKSVSRSELRAWVMARELIHEHFELFTGILAEYRLDPAPRWHRRVGGPEVPCVAPASMNNSSIDCSLKLGCGQGERVDVPADFAGVTRTERRGGSYLRYRPDRLAAVPNALSPPVTEYAGGSVHGARAPGWTATCESAASAVLDRAAVGVDLVVVDEGIRATARDVMIAQISDDAASHAANEIVRNVAAMRDAIDLLGGGTWTHEHLWTIQHELLPWQAVGYRNGQVWIGGTNKLNAQYAGPPARS